MRLTEVDHFRSPEYDLWLGRRPDGSLLLEGFLKEGETLKHLVSTVDDTKLVTAVDLMRRYGRVISRPYLLGGACDGSISAPVFALYLDFCAKHRLDAQALYTAAYPEDGVLEPESITTFARWQGVQIPHTWTAACFAGLLESLTEVNNHTLRGVLREAAEHISFPGGVLEREGYVAFRGNTRCYGPSARFTWGHVVTPTGEQIWRSPEGGLRNDPWQSTNGTVPAHYWLSFIAVAARHDGNLALAREVVTEAERSSRSPANKAHYQNWLQTLQAAREALACTSSHSGKRRRM